MPKPVALIVLDGWGLGPAGPGNGVALAHTPNVDHWMHHYPATQLNASGLDVGLPPGQIGNSEVGHLNIGAGMVVHQDSTRITLSIENEDFYTREPFLQAVQHVKDHNSRLHLIGLLGQGGVHAYSQHLFALLRLAKRHQLSEVYVHTFTDGRDVMPQSGYGYMEELLEAITEIGVGQVASVIGRYYAMDRDRRWERTGVAYEAMVAGAGIHMHDPLMAIKAAYERDPRGDEFILPTVITDAAGVALPRISDNDAVIGFNFRADRMRQITRAFMQHDFNPMVTEWYAQQLRLGLAVPQVIWQRERQLTNLFYVTMTQYDADFNIPVAFAPHYVNEPLAKVIAAAGLRQYHSAETEKYAHVTFFLNGGREEPFAGEERVLVASPKVATYDFQPEMSAAGVTEHMLEALRSKQYDFLVVNFANPDMVGHTGVIPAVVKACETVDRCVGAVVETILQQGGAAVLIADHGNAEQLIDPQTGGPHTAHTTNPVPCILVAADQHSFGRDVISLREGGKLADVAPTLLDLLGLSKPEIMTGESLIQRHKQ